MADLKGLLADPRYWDGDHPDHQDMVRQVSEQFAQNDNRKPETKSAKAGGLPVDIDAPDFQDRLFEHYLGRVKQREGGFMDDKVGGETFKGISQNLLNGLHKLGGKWKDYPEKTRELNDAQITDIYRDELFAHSQAGKVAAMPGMLAQTPELSEQLFDTGVQHGPNSAIGMLQMALDSELPGSDLRSRKGGAAPFYDGLLGERTYAALRQAMAEQKLDAVNDRMAELRLEDMEKGANYKNSKLSAGMKARADSFLTSQRKTFQKSR